jgi:hypothetical protein
MHREEPSTDTKSPKKSDAERNLHKNHLRSSCGAGRSHCSVSDARYNRLPGVAITPDSLGYAKSLCKKSCSQDDPPPFKGFALIRRICTNNNIPLSENIIFNSSNFSNMNHDLKNRRVGANSKGTPSESVCCPRTHLPR